GGGAGGLPGGLDPSKMTPEQLEQIQKMAGGKMPGLPPMPPGLGGLPKGVTPPAGMMPKLPGLGGGGLPGLGGFNPFGGKKK
ncbi:MAG: signal recognition particle protein, partial [Bosea sp. (in: a-proteobacteria)]